jgi:AhpD family alkylhydroperoxidase
MATAGRTDDGKAGTFPDGMKIMPARRLLSSACGLNNASRPVAQPGRTVPSEGFHVMSKFTAYTIETAPAASKPILESVKKGFGFVPNLQANMAESPELLAGYSTLWELFSKTSLSTTEQQVVYLSTIYENTCHYCMAGHTKLSAMQKIDPAVVQAIRAGEAINDARLEALHVFTTTVVRERGFASDAAVDTFLAAGYTRRNVLEVVLGVGTKVLSNYTNHLVHTQLDPFMAGAEWTKPGSTQAA